MPTIRLETAIAAPIERCFDLWLSVDLHMGAMASTGERAVAGVTSGLMGPGGEVTWEARHLGLRWRLTSRITTEDYQRPHRFVGELVRGPFAGFRHVHTFESLGGSSITLMRDTFSYTAPLGQLGRLIDRLFLTRYMHRLLEERNRYLIAIVEAGTDLSDR